MPHVTRKLLIHVGFEARGAILFKRYFEKSPGQMAGAGRFLSFMGPAIYKDKDVTGQQFGLYLVLGSPGVRTYKSGAKRAIWRVRCQGCDAERDVDSASVRRQASGCPSCRGKSMSAQNSPHWRGGRHVPAYFVATAKKGLQRGRLIEWTLTYDYLDKVWEGQSGTCAYTGWPLVFGTCSTEQTASLDRIDSSKGYVPGNVQFVHKDINLMKWSLSEQRFLSLCQAVVNYANIS